MYAGVTVPIYRVSIPEDLAERPESGGGQTDAAERSGPEAGRRVAVFRTGMGAPFAVAMVEELIARGARNIIVFGSCGVLDEQLAAGHYIVPTESYRDEGTSYHYAAPADYIRIRNAEKVAEVLTGHGIPFVKSRIWTTDGLYRETRKNAAARLADGCIAVDMECSALQAVCDHRGCELYQFVYAEDSLGGETWQPRNMGKVSPSEMEFHFRAALAIAAALYRYAFNKSDSAFDPIAGEDALFVIVADLLHFSDQIRTVDQIVRNVAAGHDEFGAGDFGLC